MKIGILGGSFDPPHIGHLLVAYQIREHLPLNQVWLMPCFQHPFGKKLSLPQIRLAMTKILEERQIRASDFEIKKGEVSYTIETLKSLRKLFPKEQFFWIISSDQLPEFHRWKNWRLLIQKFNWVIFPRDCQSDLEKKVKRYLKLKVIPKNIFLLDASDLIVTNIASAVIRKRVKRGLPISYLVPPKIEEFIGKNKLYR